MLIFNSRSPLSDRNLFFVVFLLFIRVGEIHRVVGEISTLVLPSLNRLFSSSGLFLVVGEKTQERRKINSRSPSLKPEYCIFNDPNFNPHF